ncbi:16S rRNA (cytosine(1402)-N(4))-methyltransferase RsmH [bacterium]|nr:16S rRNA (cytosine(1402)-N(4))-methyltransferase RsmH [bacterium]
MNHDTIHYPVFSDQIISLLDLHPCHVVLDGTCGEGGHGKILLSFLNESGYYIGLDKDAAILRIAEKRFSTLKKRYSLVHSSYANSLAVLKSLGIDHVDRILLDLGLSMFHIQQENRGFSYQSDDILDMRFDQTSHSKSAFEIIHTASMEELTEILRVYGEEVYAKKIARLITLQRKTSLIKTCQDLSQLVLRVKPYTGHIHPATKTFQALRIAVNQELADLKKMLQEVPLLLKKGGKIGIISYHSLEDRIVKQFFIQTEGLNPVNKKIILPSAEEIKINPASRSAKFRLGERL